MTVEQRYVSELGDIKAITCECLKCSSRLTIRPDNLDVKRLTACGACGHPWFDTTRDRDDLYLLPVPRFLENISRAIDANAASTAVRILLEF